MAFNETSFPLSIRPAPRKREAESLSHLINRINEERGHFRNITEASLKAEIGAREARGGRDDLEDDEVEVVDDREARSKEIYAARAEILKLIGQAQNEALTALDFISLLISKDAPMMAETYMSPLLKQLVPSGTLAFQKVQLPAPSKAQEDQNKLISTGWSFKSVETAADSLLKSATRLGEEMGRETRYWEQVLSISDRKWPVCRMPKERRTIGVRFGFSEASPTLHTRGLAALRPDANGEIILDQGLSRQPKSLRVRVEDDGIITSTSGSSVYMTSPDATGAGIEFLIRRARDSLFEEELFHELLREVRAELLSYGVNVENHVIRVPIASSGTTPDTEARHNILIDLVDVDEHQTQSHITDAKTQSTLPTTSMLDSAESIALALRLLLTQTYRQRFHKRSEPPPPISEEKRTPPIPSLLRPMISYLHHADAVRALSTFLSDVVKVLRSAGVGARYTGLVTNPDFSSMVSSAKQRSQTNTGIPSIAGALLGTIDAPLKAQAKLIVPSFSPGQEHIIVIDTTTHFSPPTYGTLFQITPPSLPAVKGDISPAPKLLPYANLRSLTIYLSYLVCRAVASSVASLSVAESAGVDASSEDFQGWRLEDNGIDLRRVWMAKKKVRRLSMVWQEGGLMVVCAENGARARMVGWWDGGKGTGRKEVSITLQEVVESAGELEV